MNTLAVQTFMLRLSMKCFNLYIAIHRQAASLYHNTSEWLDSKVGSKPGWLLHQPEILPYSYEEI